MTASWLKRTQQDLLANRGILCVLIVGFRIHCRSLRTIAPFRAQNFRPRACRISQRSRQQAALRMLCRLWRKSGALLGFSGCLQAIPRPCDPKPGTLNPKFDFLAFLQVCTNYGISRYFGPAEDYRCFMEAFYGPEHTLKQISEYMYIYIYLYFSVVHMSFCVLVTRKSPSSVQLVFRLDSLDGSV